MKNKIVLTLLATATLAFSTRAETITALTSNNRLLTFDSATPQTITSTVTITGVPAGESLVGIDFRPATGGLFALSDASRIYSINEQTGLATAVGAGGAFTLVGTSFGFDFNPTVDRIRITTDSDQDLRVNPNDGTLAATDGALAYAATDVNAGANPNVVASAYTNSFATAGATTLYDIDSNTDTLVIQNPPNSGTLNTVGSLGVDTGGLAGFDISGTTGVAYASLFVGGTTNLYTINLLNGTATAIGAIASASDAGTSIVDIAAGTKSGSRLRNISTRGAVGAGDNVLIGGFITREGGSSRLVVRAIGPSLASQGVTNPLADPLLVMFDGQGNEIARNDDYGSAAADVAELTKLGLTPTSPTESAILITLVPGAYTAQVMGKNGATGVALVEVYETR
ncbi:MAG: DUF4394 domain-containing protein [Chthoniobacterales bacterium]